MRLPCPSTRTTSASAAPWSTRCSGAPARKSATTASTATRQPTGEVSHDRDGPAEAEHLLHGLARLRAIEYGDNALREVADAGVRRLRREGTELPVGENEEAVLLGGEHQAAVGVLGMRNSAVERSTAASA